MNEHDCQCSFCKNHTCSVIRNDKGVGCSDPNCDRNNKLPYFIRKKETLIKEFIDFTQTNMRVMAVLSGHMNPEAEEQLIEFLKNQKRLFIDKEKKIIEDL